MSPHLLGLNQAIRENLLSTPVCHRSCLAFMSISLLLFLFLYSTLYQHVFVFLYLSLYLSAPTDVVASAPLSSASTPSPLLPSPSCHWGLRILGNDGCKTCSCEVTTFNWLLQQNTMRGHQRLNTVCQPWKIYPPPRDIIFKRLNCIISSNFNKLWPQCHHGGKKRKTPLHCLQAWRSHIPGECPISKHL